MFKNVVASYLDILCFVSPLCSYSGVTSGLSDGNDGQSDKGNQDAAKPATAKQFKRRARARLRIIGVKT